MTDMKCNQFFTKTTSIKKYQWNLKSVFYCDKKDDV